MSQSEDIFVPGKQLVEYKNLAQVGTGISMENDLDHNTASVPHGSLGRYSAYGEVSHRAQSGPCWASGGTPPSFKSQPCQLPLSILCSCVSQAVVPILLLNGWSPQQQQHHLGVYWKCRIWGSTPHRLNQCLRFN